MVGVGVAGLDSDLVISASFHYLPQSYTITTELLSSSTMQFICTVLKFCIWLDISHLVALFAQHFIKSKFYNLKVYFVLN